MELRNSSTDYGRSQPSVATTRCPSDLALGMPTAHLCMASAPDHFVFLFRLSWLLVPLAPSLPSLSLAAIAMPLFMTVGHLLFILLCLVTASSATIAMSRASPKLAVTDVSRSLNLSQSSNLVIYWGQDCLGSEPSLASLCTDAAYDVVILSFLDRFGNGTEPHLDLADHCTDTFPHSHLLHCPQVGQDNLRLPGPRQDGPAQHGRRRRPSLLRQRRRRQQHGPLDMVHLLRRSSRQQAVRHGRAGRQRPGHREQPAGLLRGLHHLYPRAVGR